MSLGRKILAFVGLAVLVLFYQNCSSTHFFDDGSNSTVAQQTGDGQVFDGKVRILHHIVDGFKCEGRLAPESILMRNAQEVWHYTKNEPSKCAALEKDIPESEVSYDDTLKVALYNGDKYVPPFPYDVTGVGDPNSADANVMDGVCANANGFCSLQAAVDQAAVTALTESVLVRVPAGTFALTKRIPVFLDPGTHSVKIQGQGAQSTILDGQNTVPHFLIHSMTTEPVSIDGMSLVNGLDGVAFEGASIQVGIPAYSQTPQSLVKISNCLFQNNQNSGVVRGHANSGRIEIRSSKFMDSGMYFIHVTDNGGLFVDDSEFTRAGNRGIVLTVNTGSVDIRNSSFSEMYEGISLYDCRNCTIENVSVYRTLSAGMYIATSKYDPAFNFTIKQTTLYDNGIQPNQWGWPTGSLLYGFTSPTNTMTITNSIFANPVGSGQKNCPGSSGSGSRRIYGTNNIFDDATCEVVGTGNIMADPMLNTAANNGGLTTTLMPRAGSPAIDAGSNAVCTAVDQRGVPRLTASGPAARCDIGSVEVQ